VLAGSADAASFGSLLSPQQRRTAPSFLVVSAAESVRRTAVGMLVAAAPAIDADIATLVGSKRAELAGALLVAHYGTFLAVPHALPWRGDSLRLSATGATDDCVDYSMDRLSAEIKGAYLAVGCSLLLRASRRRRPTGTVL
jgi:hypothetical protein